MALDAAFFRFSLASLSQSLFLCSRKSEYYEGKEQNEAPHSCSQFEENQINNLYEAYKWYTSTYGNTVHMTMIFNTFVF